MDTFKSCPSCNASWATRTEFLADPSIFLVGYQQSYSVSKPGLFLFNHATCGSTIAVAAEDFKDMHDAEICQRCESRQGRSPDYCCRGATGEQAPEACVCKFTMAIERKLGIIMRSHARKTDSLEQ